MLVDKIPNMSKNSRHTTSTSTMNGIELMSDVTAIRKPGALEIILSGLSTLIIRRLLNTPRSTPWKMREMREKMTMKKSMMFQLFLMYESSPLNAKPYTMIFKTISKVNSVVMMMSKIQNT